MEGQKLIRSTTC